MSSIKPLHGAPDRLQSWVFADATARLAMAVSPDDVGRLAFDQDTMGFYWLRQASPVAWEPLISLNLLENLLIERTSTSPTENQDSLSVITIFDPSSTPSGLFGIRGIYSQIIIPDTMPFDVSASVLLNAFRGTTFHSGSGNVAVARGGAMYAGTLGAGSTMDNAGGILGEVLAYGVGANIVAGRAVEAASPNFIDATSTYRGGHIDTSYGFYGYSQESPYVDRAVGLYMEGADTENILEGHLKVGNVIEAVNDPTTPLYGAFGAPPRPQPVVTGSWSDGSAGASLAAALASLGWIVDSTTP